MQCRDGSLDPSAPAMVRTRCAVIHTRKAARAVTQLFDMALLPSGVRATQFTLLVAAHEAGGMQMSELAEQLLMDRTTLTRELKLLEKEGLVAIAVGQDRRARTVSLTTEGNAALARALPLWDKAQRHIEERLGTERWQGILGCLNDIALAAR
jgi:DNA-binding MarR family transcriptional regulator